MFFTLHPAFFLFFSTCAGAALPTAQWRLSSSPGLNLINGTPWAWKLNSTAVGELPNTVEPFSVFSLESIGSASEAVTYVLDTAGSPSFLLDVETQRVTFTGMSTLGNPQGSTIQLWVDKNDDENYANFVLAGNDTANLVSSNPPKNWIQSVLPVFGGMPLSQFFLPGSHDAGMALLDLNTAASKECNTLTQTGKILSQLETGARYFDIRPVISGGKFKSGHYTGIGALGHSITFQGGNGESLQDIVDDINTFTQDKAEVIVVRLAHDLNTDVGNSNYRPFNVDELNQLYALLGTIKDLYIASSPTVDLTTLTLNDLTSNGTRSAVIILFRLDSDVQLGNLQGRGLFYYQQLNAYNEFSSTNELDDMMSDQLAKMKEQRANSTYFLLSWTLTQNAFDTISCPLISDSIIEMAVPARKALFTKLLPAVSGNEYPQMMQIDDFSSADIVPLALSLLYKAQATRS